MIMSCSEDVHTLWRNHVRVLMVRQNLPTPEGHFHILRCSTPEGGSIGMDGLSPIILTNLADSMSHLILAAFLTMG